MKIYDNTEIYIFCPPSMRTGGPEALHQLRYYLEKCGYNAYIVYNFSDVKKCDERYEEYSPIIKSFKEVKDRKENVIICPESQTYILKNYKEVVKCVWWLSFNNYDGFLITAKKKLNIAVQNFGKKIINLFKKNKYKYYGTVKLSSVDYNFCACKYAYDKISVDKRMKNPLMLVEPISKDFLEIGRSNDLKSENRSDVIVYNPAKKSAIMEELLKRDDLKFMPIIGMTPKEIAELFRKTKLYIDFGEFPGAERIPKESVYNGTCIIVGKKNAAVNDFDVPIPDRYKLDHTAGVEEIVKNIKYVLDNYDTCIRDFEFFRDKIDGLEEYFMKTLKTFFVKS